jgi:hypothetical protein
MPTVGERAWSARSCPSSVRQKADVRSVSVERNAKGLPTFERRCPSAKIGGVSHQSEADERGSPWSKLHVRNRSGKRASSGSELTWPSVEFRFTQSTPPVSWCAVAHCAARRTAAVRRCLMAWRSGQAYSQDLRDRVLRGEGSNTEVAARFEVTQSYLSRVRSRERRLGLDTPGARSVVGHHWRTAGRLQPGDSLDRCALSIATARRLCLFTDQVISRCWQWQGVERLQRALQTSARRRSSRLDDRSPSHCFRLGTGLPL